MAGDAAAHQGQMKPIQYVIASSTAYVVGPLETDGSRPGTAGADSSQPLAHGSFASTNISENMRPISFAWILRDETFESFIAYCDCGTLAKSTAEE